MCGIFGYTKDKKEVETSLLNKMGDLQFHRGPNGLGTYIDEKVALGMRRLSIIDLAHGNQPFFSKNKQIVVFCNGEIYNYIEVRQELKEKHNIEFKTNSDIEIIPHLYELYGEAFVHQLNGMFAIAIYDKKADKVLLYRDRLGIKPIYYSTINNKLVYSSELKSILAHSHIQKALDFDALSIFFELMYIPAPLTPFKDIYKLEPGSYLKWENGKKEVKKYWNAKLNVESNRNEEDWIEEMDATFQSSVKLRLRSDVPVGAFLSGGIDSSGITAMAALHTQKELSSFHIRWDNVPWKIDESGYARQVADQYKTTHYQRNISSLDIPKLLPKLIWHLEEPFGDAAFVPTYVLSNIASEKVTVILSGAGGDELFGGYHHHIKQSILKSIAGKVFVDRAPAWSYYDMWATMNKRHWKNHLPWRKNKIFKSEFEAIYNANKPKDRLNAIMLNDIGYYLPDNILFLTDKMSMATSLEARVPFLDHRMVELAFQIPSQQKMVNAEKKYLLKKYLNQYLPNEVLYRKKEGFGSPVWSWINKYKNSHFDEVLLNGALIKENLVDAQFIKQLTKKEKYSRREAWVYWCILIFEIWFRIFMNDIPQDMIFEASN